MKKQALAIQCHNKPEQINKMIEFLSKEYFDFYIHVDKKSDITDKITKQENVFFVQKRVDVRWGQGSQVEATLAILDSIKNPSEYSYVHLISGNDFPIKTNEDILQFFDENKKEYIGSIYLDGSYPWPWGGFDRFECYYPQFLIHRPANKPMRVLRVAYREFIMRTKIFKRKNKPVSKFYGGPSWWSLTGNMVEWMIKYLNKHPDYIEYFKHGVCVDEVFFSTLVRYSPYQENLVENCLRYMNWGDPTNNSGGPAVLTLADIDEMIKSEKFFARKFTDIETINKLVEKLNNK